MDKGYNDLEATIERLEFRNAKLHNHNEKIEQEIIEFANNFNFPEYDEESRKVLLEQYDRVYKQHKKDKEFNRMYAQFKLNPLRRTEQRNRIARSNRIENFLKDIKVHDDEYEAQFIQDLEDHMYE